MSKFLCIHTHDCSCVDVAEHQRALKAQQALFNVADMHYREQLAEVERLKNGLFEEEKR